MEPSLKDRLVWYIVASSSWRVSYLGNEKLELRTKWSVFPPVSHPNVRHIGSSYVVWGHALSRIVWPQPVLKLGFLIWTFQSSAPSTCFTSWLKPLMRTLFLASSHRSQLESLKICAAMLYSSIKGSLKGRLVFLQLQDFYLGEVELEGVICGEGHVEAPGKRFSFSLCSAAPNCQFWQLSIKTIFDLAR